MKPKSKCSVKDCSRKANSFYHGKPVCSEHFCELMRWTIVPNKNFNRKKYLKEYYIRKKFKLETNDKEANYE